MFGNKTLAMRYARAGRPTHCLRKGGRQTVSQVVGLALCLFGSLSGSAGAQAYKFETIAGGYLGDGQPAVNAGLSTPRGIAFDAAGNLYIAQANENRIRKVTPGGIISTFAGTGAYGFAGDQGPAAQAAFRSPRSVAVDAAGNVYVSDAFNNRIRKISTAGVISTFAGNGTDASSGDGGLAIDAGVRRPHGMAFDAVGNLYVAEGLGHRVRKITPAGAISTAAGNGVPGDAGDNGPAIDANLNEPSGVAFDAAGNMFISEIQNNSIRRVDTAGNISRFASGIDFPFGIAVGPDDKVYVSDVNCFIRRVDAVGVTTKIAGGEGICQFTGDGGPAVDANITTPEGIAFDPAGNLHFVDSDVFRVRKIVGGVISTVVGRGEYFGDGGPAVNAMFRGVKGVAVGPDGNVYVTDAYPGNRVRKIDSAGIISTFAGIDQGADWSPDADDGDGGPATAASLFMPTGVTLDNSGNVYITESTKVRKVGTDGIIRKMAGGFSGYEGDGGPATSASLRRPSRSAFDAHGNMYIADTRNHVIRKVDAAGIITTIAGTGTSGFSGDGGPATASRLSSPNAVVVDAMGNVFIADTDYARIRKVTPAGVISTIAGNGNNGAPTGDGGPAVDAAINRPLGLALDAAGNLYIAGTELRKVTPAGIISTIAEMKNFAYDVAIDKKGAIYVATLDGRVLRSGQKLKATSDYNGDGDSDVYWRNATTGNNAYWPSAASSRSTGKSTVIGANWNVIGSGDFNADNRSDIVWNNPATGESTIWFSASSATYQRLSRVIDITWKIAGIGDFDGNGRADILWHNIRTGANSIWRNGNYADYMPVGRLTDVTWVVAGVDDFDGDGKADILWHHIGNGANMIWPSANYSLSRPLAKRSDTRWQVAGTGDFDGDGKADIVWYHSDGSSGIWKSGDAAKAQAFTRMTDTAWRIASIGDFNGDGKSDLLWRRAGNGKMAIWKSGSAGAAQWLIDVADPNWKIVD